MTEPNDGSRVEAAEAGAHHEAAEVAAGLEPREHVTASDAALQAAHPHHHPDDPNAGVLRGAPGRGALLTAAVVAVVTVVAVVALAVAIGGK